MDMHLEKDPSEGTAAEVTYVIAPPDLPTYSIYLPLFRALTVFIIYFRRALSAFIITFPGHWMHLLVTFPGHKLHLLVTFPGR